MGLFLKEEKQERDEKMIQVGPLYVADRLSKYVLYYMLSMLFTVRYYYSQTRIKCSRPISSLRGLQGHKIFADAIIKILIATKSIIGKNCHDQLFINEVKVDLYRLVHVA